MSIESKFVVMQSGLSSWQFTGSQTVSVCLLCGMSGTSVIPMQVNSSGRLIVQSGA